MSYNGSGTFVINSAGQPVVTGTVISSTAFNALTADLGTGLSTAITKDGQTTTTSRILFAQGISSTLTTDATSTTTGSIITAGGISTQKALFVGTTSNFAGAITYGGVTLSNAVTGTGNMVLSASPTLTGTVSTQNVQPTADATHNIGGASNRYAGAFAGHLSDGSQAAGEMVGSGGTTMRLGNGSGWTGISTTKSLGIGMTPVNVLDITQSTNGASAISLLNSNGGVSARAEIYLNNGTSFSLFRKLGSAFTTSGMLRQDGLAIQENGAGGLTLTTGAAQPIYFGINSTERARIGTDGSFLVGGTTNAGAGVISANAGVIVAASQSTLANYTTGSWTPTDVSGAGISFSVASGKYVRIGNIVHLMAVINWPVTASAVGVLIGGLPFTSGDYYFGVLNTNGTSGTQAYTIAGQAQLTYSIAAGTAAILNSTQSGASTRLTIVYAV